ncbi:hypothetical protein PMHK_11950 [Pseudomonas sp. MHK4]|jgi:hypothetical protein
MASPAIVYARETHIVPERKSDAHDAQRYRFNSGTEQAQAEKNRCVGVQVAHYSRTPGTNSESAAEGESDYAASNRLKAAKKKLERVTRPCLPPKMACFL